MDFVYLFLINFLSISLLFLLFVLWKKVRLQFAQPLIFDLVVYFVFLKIILIFFIPAFLRFLSNWQYDKVIDALPSDIATVYIIESISYVVWMFSIFLVTKMTYFKKMSKKINILSERDSFRKGKEGSLNLTTEYPHKGFRKKRVYTEEIAKLYLLVLCALYLIFNPDTFKAYQFTGGLAYFIKPAVLMAGPVVGLYIFSLGRKAIGNLTFILGIVITLLSLIYGLATGVRGQIVGPAMWLFFLYFFVSRKKYVLYTSILGVITVFFLHSAMVEVRSMKGHIEKPAKERIQSFVTAKNTSKEQKNFLDNMEFRFGEASRLSVAFVRLYEIGMSAGLEPIKSALYAPLPRRFFKDKPQPGSVDGTREGMGMYIIQKVMRAEPWNMSDFFTGVHAYWEIGLPAVILFSLLSGVFIAYCANYFAGFSLAGLPLMMIMLKPWWNEPKLWIAQTILQVVHILVPLMIIWYVSRCAFRIIRELKKCMVLAVKQ